MPKPEVEQSSIDNFVKEVIRKVRPKGTNVAVTHVLLATARAAAGIAARTSTGAIDKKAAYKIFQEAVSLGVRLEHP